MRLTLAYTFMCVLMICVRLSFQQDEVEPCNNDIMKAIANLENRLEEKLSYFIEDKMTGFLEDKMAEIIQVKMATLLQNKTTDIKNRISTIENTTSNLIEENKSELDKNLSNLQLEFQEVKTGCPVTEGYFVAHGSGQCLRLFMDEQRSWDKSVEKCKSHGLVLAKIFDHNAMELKQQILDRDKIYNGFYLIWVGARGDGFTYRWVRDDEVLPYDSPLWRHGGPGKWGAHNTRCLEFIAYGDKPYGDMGCGYGGFALCENIFISRPDSLPDSPPDIHPDSIPDCLPDSIPDNPPDSELPETVVDEVLTASPSTTSKPRVDSWLSSGQCGPKNRLPDGRPAQCNPNGKWPCCQTTTGWCGNTAKHCTCTECIDYRRNTPSTVMAQHKIFVYGTLKRNEPNHHWLTNSENGIGKLLGMGNTVEKYPLVIASRYNIPYVLAAPGQGNNIEGEVYSVDEKMLSKLDILENHPKYYERKVKKIKFQESGQEVECWIYLLHKFKPHLLELPLLISFHSEGDHDLPYVAPHLRSEPVSESWTDVKQMLGS